MRIALAAALMAVVLTGCTDSDSNESETPAPTATATTTVTADPEPVPEEVTESELTDAEIDAIFLIVVRKHIPEAVLIDDSILIDNAVATCEALNVGVPVSRVLEIGLESGLTAEQVGVMSGAAVASYCPEHGHLFD